MSDDPEVSDEADTIWANMVGTTRPIDLAAADLRGERYEKARVLGIGGMGEVTLVRDHRIGRDVALKTVREAVATPEARGAFIAEARMQAQLEHPSIIPVYDIGIDTAGREYFTMRAIVGTTLSKVLARLREGDRATVAEYTMHRLLETFRRLCLVIEYAHGKGVIHRDLKPANVMLGEYGEIHVLDWGLAQKRGIPVESSDPESPVLGTPGYLAPEQTFKGSEIDHRTDVYSLGAILFEILALRPLHAGRDSEEKLKSTRRKHNATAQQRAPERDIPPELDAACARATAYAPAHRFATVAALREELDKFLEGRRNQELRVTLAATHAATAYEATQSALAGGPEAEQHRRRALQDIARSLALDPDNHAARQALVKLIAEPPQLLPVEVAEEIDRGTADEGRFAAKLGAFSYATFAVIAIVAPQLQGVNSWPGLAVVIASALVGALWCIRGSRKFRPREYVPIFVLGSIAIITATGFYGPLVMVPVLASAHLMAYNFAAMRNFRTTVFVIGLLVFLIPTLAEWFGVVDPFYTVEAGRIVIAPRFVDFDETMVRIALTLVNLAAIVVPTLVVWRLADSKDELRRKHVLQSWQLRQLVS